MNDLTLEELQSLSLGLYLVDRRWGLRPHEKALKTRILVRIADLKGEVPSEQA